MPRISHNRLSARAVASLKDGVFADGGNLWLTVKGNTRAWSVRYTRPVTGKAREMGIGSTRTISLADARERAAVARKMIADGLDPLEIRQQERSAQKKETGLTFEQVALRYIKEQAPGWKDRRGEAIWQGSLGQHVFPVFGSKPVGSIDTDDVLKALRPIWTRLTETAQRLRGRIERVLDYARSQGWREGENPARWKSHLSAILPKPGAVATVKHHAAVPRQDLPAIMQALQQSRGTAARAVQFVCLTAARSGEVRGVVWSEIDMQARMWVIPAERMKMKREHRVPLSDGAVAILQEMLPLRAAAKGDWVFPGQKAGRPLSDVALSKALHLAAGTKDVTVHGLRSTFRDWAAEETDYPREVAEMALAHAIGDKVEAAYWRGDLFEKRRGIMNEWNKKLIYLYNK
ncbi:tyrosine-type recombinase/integrase [Komagataeibacter oboediens]|uniref:tyrosine-type recombinase/integrase n=1 Tax=Komagataeibacter oboediens TaxID=65958 RepID=UPI0019085F7E|nr:tyrosine-type recombinase/integrase [Komagataeibacter oboediens]GCE80657.1 phage integrase [Komagataeibacter oboediens]